MALKKGHTKKRKNQMNKKRGGAKSKQSRKAIRPIDRKRSNKQRGGVGLIGIPQYSPGGTALTTTDFDSVVPFGRYAPRLSYGTWSSGMCQK